jgi:hypothetical protein
MYQASNRPESPPNCPSKTAPTDDAQDTNYWDQIKNKKGPLGAMQADLPRTAQQWPGTLPEKQLKSRPKEEEDMITGLNLNTTALYIQSLQACHARSTPCSRAPSSAEPPVVASHQANNAYGLPSVKALIQLHQDATCNPVPSSWYCLPMYSTHIHAACCSSLTYLITRNLLSSLLKPQVGTHSYCTQLTPSTMT